MRCTPGAGECSRPRRRSGTPQAPKLRATACALWAAALQTACPQLLDDDFGRAGSGEPPGTDTTPPNGSDTTPPNGSDTTPPSVLASTPSDGARGVASDARIEISFSEPMDTRATEAAYTSSDLPARQVSFYWRDGDRVLSIEPQAPLSIATGTQLAQVEAHEYHIQLTSVAADRAGNPLAPFGMTFAVVRELTQVIAASSDRTLSGNWRSNDSYGVEVCEEGDTSICVGDSLALGNPTYRGFASFDLSTLPADRQTIRGATLTLTIAESYNDPFGTLGVLQLEHLHFSSIGSPSFEQAADASLGTLATQGDVGDTFSADVGAAVRADAAQGRSQYRLRFERDSEDILLPNLLVFELADTRLSVTCLMP